MSFLLIGAIATAFNFLVIFWKYQHRRYLDATLDLLTMVIISVLFAGTIAGLQIGMIASMLISLYLLINPPKLSIKFDFLDGLL